MPRRLNIERRRKRIRHYTARRRRRSPLRRAFSFWWSAVTVTAAAAALMGAAFAKTFRAPGSWRSVSGPMPASLAVLHASEEAVASLIRMGNVRRQTLALSNADIGISLVPLLPEPRRSAGGRPPAAPAAAPKAPLAEPPRTLPQAFALEEVPALAAPKGTLFRPDARLRVADFRCAMPKAPSGTSAGVARFWVALDGAGRPETVLRLSPKGAESPWLKQVRLAVLAGQGSGTAAGMATVAWGEEVAP